MPLPSVINTNDTFQTWLDGTNNLISELTNTSIFVRTGSSNVVTGNVHVNGTILVSSVSVNTGAVFGGTWFNVSSNIAATGANIVFGGTDVKLSSNTLFIGAVNIITSNLVVGNAVGSQFLVNATMNVVKATAFANTVSIAGSFSADSQVLLGGPYFISNTFSISANLASNAASYNDWAPTGHATAAIIKVTPDVDGTVITGITVANTSQHRRVIIENTGNFTITFVHESASSSANNRIALPGNTNMSLIKQSGTIFLYDPTSARWRIVSASSTAGSDVTANSLTVSGLSTLTGNVTMGGTLVVAGLANISGNLTVTGFANVLSTLQVAAGTSLNSLAVGTTLTVTANTTLNSYLLANGQVRCDTTNGRLVLPVGADKWAT